MFYEYDWPSVEEAWTQVDLKTFFSILSLEKPNIKQSDIAKELGITAATLSRIINSAYGDGKMREEWIPILKPYLMLIDTIQFDKKWRALKVLHDNYDMLERHAMVRQILGSEWSYNQNQRIKGTMLFYGKDTSWFMFDISPVGSVAPQIEEFISRNIGFINGYRQVRLSLLCYDLNVFNKCVAYLEKSPEIKLQIERGGIFSAILVNISDKRFENEYIICQHEES